MTDSNTSKNSELQIIQEHLDHASGNALLCSDNSDMINSLSNENLQVLTNTSHSISIHIDNLLLTNTFHLLHPTIYLPIHQYGGGLGGPHCCGIHNARWVEK